MSEERAIIPPETINLIAWSTEISKIFILSLVTNNTD